MPSTAPLPGQVGGQAGQAGSLGVASPRLSAWDNGGWETTFSGFGDVGFDAPAALHSSCRAQVLTAVSPARRPCASAGDREDTLATSTNSNATPAPATVAPPAPGLSTTPTTAGLSEYDWRQLSEVTCLCSPPAAGTTGSTCTRGLARTYYTWHVLSRAPRDFAGGSDLYLRQEQSGHCAARAWALRSEGCVARRAGAAPRTARTQPL